MDLRTLIKLGVHTPEDVVQVFSYTKTENYLAEIVEYADENIFKIYRTLMCMKHKSKVRTCCSKCGHEQELTKYPSSQIECPNCKSMLKVRNAKFESSWLSGGYEFVYFSKSDIDENCILGHQVRVSMWFNKSNETRNKAFGARVATEYKVKDVAFYYFDRLSKNVKVSWSEWAGYRFCKTIFADGAGTASYYGVVRESLKKAASGTPFAYALAHMQRDLSITTNAYNTSDTLKVIDQFTKLPHAEKLYNAGFGSIAKARLHGQRNFGCVNWKADTVQGMLKLNNGLIRYFRSAIANDTYGPVCLKCIQDLSKCGYDAKEIEAGLSILATTGYDPVNLSVLNHDRPSRIKRYIDKQILNFDKRYNGYFSVLRDMKDMIKDMEKLGIPVNKGTLYPKDLYAHHMNLHDQVEVKVTAEKDLKIQEIAQELEKLRFETDGFIIKPIENSNELIEEGKELNHCVSSYLDKHVERKTTIFVVRSKNRPDKPFYTMELDIKQKTLVQCRGKANKDYSYNPEVKTLVDSFVALKLKGAKNHEKSKCAN